MHLSVIIPSFNAADTIGDLLISLAQQQYPQPWEVIVADNGSSDETLSIAQRFSSHLPLHTVSADHGRGAAVARNHGARVARGKNLVFLDADDMVKHDYIACIGHQLEQHRFVASRLEIERLNEPWQVESRPHQQVYGLMQVGYPPKLHHAAGSGLGVRRSLHEQVGGFDEDLLRLQDTDYCFRIQLAGEPLHFADNAVVHMRFRDSIGSMFRQSRLWGEYNVLLANRYKPDHLTPPGKYAWIGYGRRWLRQIGRLPTLRSRSAWARWVRVCGWQIGLLQGSLRYKHPPI